MTEKTRKSQNLNQKIIDIINNVSMTNIKFSVLYR